MTRSAYWILGLSALLLACEEVPVQRHVQLTAEDGWPRAETSYVNNALRVEVTRMEPLRATSAMTAWLHLHDGSARRAGVVASGAPTFLDGTALGVDWTQVHEVVITEENAAETPTTPSTSVLFEGAPGGTLSASVEGSVSGLTASAVLSDGTLTVTAPTLPLMGPWMYYGVWLVGSRAPGDAGTEPTLVGRMFGRGTVAFANLGVTALRREVALTVEFESGPDTASLSAVVLRGVVPTSGTALTSTGSSAPESEAPTSHVH